MSDHETLADKVIRQTLRPKTLLRAMTKRSMGDIRSKMLDARKFVLDDSMSSFLADLSMTPFRVDSVRRDSALDSIRHGAMLPFPRTWIEINGRAFKKRMIELEANFINVESGVGGLIDPSAADVPVTWGWLLEEHPQMPNAIMMQEFIDDVDIKGVPLIATLPFQWVWNVKDEPIPWANADINAGMLGHGIVGYFCPQIGIILDKPLEKKTTKVVNIGGSNPFSTHTLVAEMGGAARYVLCLLATLNDVPVLITEVKPQRGYYARGNYRKFVDHKTLRLQIPQRSSVRMLAKRLIAITRRRGGEVRAHWRLYQRGAEGLLCAYGTHEWGPLGDDGHAPCLRCPAWRTWIKKYDRGDAMLGIVTHDYALTHDKLTGDFPKSI